LRAWAGPVSFWETKLSNALEEDCKARSKVLSVEQLSITQMLRASAETDCILLRHSAKKAAELYEGVMMVTCKGWA